MKKTWQNIINANKREAYGCKPPTKTWHWLQFQPTVPAYLIFNSKLVNSIARKWRRLREYRSVLAPAEANLRLRSSIYRLFPTEQQTFWSLCANASDLCVFCSHFNFYGFCRIQTQVKAVISRHGSMRIDKLIPFIKRQ